MTKTNKDGTTAFNIKDTLEKLGFNCTGIKCNLEDITKDNIILPCIASVVLENSYNHFVVIYEINFKHKYLIIGDPADKVKKVNFLDFQKIFNKVLIIFFPIKSIPYNKSEHNMKLIFNLLLPYKKIILNIFSLSIFITVFSVITSFYTEYMINGINFNSKYYLFLIFSIFFSIYILKCITDFFRNKLLLFLNQKIDLTLTLDIYNKIIKLPYNYYQNRKTGDIVSRVNDLDNVRDTISKVGLALFMDLPLTLISMLVLYIINRTLFVIGVLILFLYFLIIIIFRRVFNDYIKDIKINKSESMSYMIESISGFETVKGIHIEGDIIHRFEKKYVIFLKKVFKFQNLYILQNLLKDIVNNIGFIFITLISCILVIQGKMSIGNMFTFSALLIYFLEPIKNIINLDTTIKEANSSLQRIIDISSYSSSDIGVLDDFKNGNIEIKNLNFSFNDRDLVLKNINLNIKKNSKIMIIGSSGGGKSTLFKLLMQYYKVDNNKILIGENDINNYTKAAINNNILYISQNEILFNDTVYNNIVFDNNCFNLQKVLDICSINEILNSNLGLNTLIEENGFNLSGGQKQRIVLARTLMRNFEILLIDEGLNEVDINLERKILKKIFKEYSEKTILIISHRLDNLDLFDGYIRIDKGKISEVKYKNA